MLAYRFGGNIVKLRVLVTTAALALTLTACGDSGSKSDLPALSASPKVAKKTTGTLLDKVPAASPERPKDVQSEAGAVSFGSYVFDVLFYTLATNDIDEFLSIADSKFCATCKEVSAAIEKRPDTLQVGSESHEVSQGKVITNSDGFYTVRQQVKFPKGAEIDKKSGKVVEKLASDKAFETVNMQWRRGAWVLLDYKISQKDAS